MVTIIMAILSQPYNLNLQPPQFYNCTGSVTCSRSGPWLNINGTGGGGGGVSSVSASSPLASSGGSTPNISLTGTVSGTNGGLGAAQPTCSGGQFLTCNGTVCTCGTPSGGSGGAPADAGYVVWGTATSGSTNERVLTAGTHITLDTSTPGQLIVNASGGGGGGGGNIHAASGNAYFDGGSLDAITTVTAAWSSPTHTIICRPTGLEASVEGAQATVISQAAGSFVVRTEPRQGSHYGNLPFVCLGH